MTKNNEAPPFMSVNENKDQPLPADSFVWQDISHRLAIDDLLTRYTIAIDDENFDLLDTVFTQDAILDYTSAGGPRDRYPVVKAWLEDVLTQNHPARQHIIANKQVTIEGDEAKVRAYFFNPNAFNVPEYTPGASPDHDSQRVIYSLGGGYYNHKLKLTPKGWRSVELFELRVWRQGYPPRPHPHAKRSTETWDFGAAPRPRE